MTQDVATNSPIEDDLTVALLRAGWIDGDISMRHQDVPMWLIRRRQWRVGGLKYEFDFALVMRDERGALFPVADIEADGHRYHSLTKEQARRDRSRDRHLALHGVAVIRFTGSEIWGDAGECAVEIGEFVSAEWARRNHHAPILDPDRDARAHAVARELKTLIVDVHSDVQMLRDNTISEHATDEWLDNHQSADEGLVKAVRLLARLVG